MAHQHGTDSSLPPTTDHRNSRVNFSADHLKNDQSPDSVLHEKQHEEDVDNINYPPPWKWERYFIGGYSQGRMLKFKNPKTMYKAINLFAGVAIMFYGYDQGVMSQVNLNEDYWNHSMFAFVS